MAEKGTVRRKPRDVGDDEGFEGIGIADDLMFKEVFGRDPVLAGRLLETILEREVGEVEYVDAQREERVAPAAKGTTFDVYLRTKEGLHGDVEMQKERRRNLPLRLRAYLSNIEREALRRGEKYTDARETVAVFICTFDPVGKGLTRYTVRRCILETEELFEDRQTGILLNAKGPGDDVSPELAAFLRYVSGYDVGEGPGGDFVDAVDASVRATRASWDWRRSYVTLQEMMDDAAEVGREEGREEGIDIGVAKVVRRMMDAKGIRAEEAMDAALVPAEDRPRLLALLERGLVL